MQLTAKDLHEMREAFDAYATDGRLDYKCINAALLRLGVRSSVEITHQTKREPISFDAFVELLKKILSERSFQEKTAQAFKLLDADGTGKVSFKNLKDASALVGADFSDKNLREMIAEADSDGDGQIDLSEFMRVMRRSRQLPQ